MLLIVFNLLYIIELGNFYHNKHLVLKICIFLKIPYKIRNYYFENIIFWHFKI